MNPRAQGRSLRGFSLVELLIVVAIILLLAALAMPRYLDAQKSAYEAGVVSLLRTLQTDQESYRLATGVYSDNFTDLGLAARGSVPENPFAPEASPRLANLLLRAGSFQVYAAQSDQQPPAKSPPPPPPAKQDFGGQPPKKKPEKIIGGPRGLDLGQPGSGPGKGGSGNPPSGRPRRGGAGAGSGAPSGGSSSGGGAGGQSGAAAPGGGVGGPAAPLAGPAAKSNILLKHTYIFTLQRPTPTTWSCSAAPIRDRGNSKFLFMDQSGMIRSELGKPATATSPQM